MSLDAIVQGSEFTGLTDSQVVSALNADVDGSGDQTPYTWSGLTEKLIYAGVNAGVIFNLRTVLLSLPGGSVFDACLASGGVNFGNAANRALLSASKSGADSATQALIDSILSIGSPRKKWQVSGLNSLPSESDVVAARSRNLVQQKWAMVCNEIVGPMLSNSTWDQIKTAIEGT